MYLRLRDEKSCISGKARRRVCGQMVYHLDLCTAAAFFQVAQEVVVIFCQLLQVFRQETTSLPFACCSLVCSWDYFSVFTGG
jgi:hypothetical protein